VYSGTGWLEYDKSLLIIIINGLNGRLFSWAKGFWPLQDRSWDRESGERQLRAVTGQQTVPGMHGIGTRMRGPSNPLVVNAEQKKIPKKNKPWHRVTKFKTPVGFIILLIVLTMVMDWSGRREEEERSERREARGRKREEGSERREARGGKREEGSERKEARGRK
jgi:hypothetical protein